LEPELMEQPEQVKAYAEADFEAPHSRFIELLQQHFNRPEFAGTALDLGCGPGDISRRFAIAYPNARVEALDGSKAMLDYAALMLPPELAVRMAFIHAKLPVTRLPQSGYAVIFSNSLLHHLPAPQVLWDTVKQFANAGAFVAAMDLLRPAGIAAAQRLVEQYAADEPPILQTDFYASLLAAFTLKEIKQQLRTAELSLAIQQIGDRHVFISGFMPD
jgi:trans-aconitate methyltransferase